MTDKQIQTLLLYAQNFSMPKISDRMGVCLTTTRCRLKALAKNHQREFNNALGIREVYKRTRDAIKQTKNFSDLNIGNIKSDGDYSGSRSTIEGISSITKQRLNF